MQHQLQSPLQRQIERVRHIRRLIAAEDDLLPSTRVGIKHMQQRLAAAAAASKDRNSQLLQQLDDTAQLDASCSAAANVQLCALRAAYHALVARSFPNWYEAVAVQLAEVQAAQQNPQQAHAALQHPCSSPSSHPTTGWPAKPTADQSCSQHQSWYKQLEQQLQQQQPRHLQRNDSVLNSLHSLVHRHTQQQSKEATDGSTATALGRSCVQQPAAVPGVGAPAVQPELLQQLTHTLAEQLSLLQQMVQLQQQQQQGCHLQQADVACRTEAPARSASCARMQQQQQPQHSRTPQVLQLLTVEELEAQQQQQQQAMDVPQPAQVSRQGASNAAQGAEAVLAAKEQHAISLRAPAAAAHARQQQHHALRAGTEQGVLQMTAPAPTGAEAEAGFACAVADTVSSDTCRSCSPPLAGPMQANLQPLGGVETHQHSLSTQQQQQQQQGAAAGQLQHATCTNGSTEQVEAQHAALHLQYSNPMFGEEGSPPPAAAVLLCEPGLRLMPGKGTQQQQQQQHQQNMCQVSCSSTSSPLPSPLSSSSSSELSSSEVSQGDGHTPSISSAGNIAVPAAATQVAAADTSIWRAEATAAARAGSPFAQAGTSNAAVHAQCHVMSHETADMAAAAAAAVSGHAKKPAATPPPPPLPPWLAAARGVTTPHRASSAAAAAAAAAVACTSSTGDEWAQPTAAVTAAASPPLGQLVADSSDAAADNHRAQHPSTTGSSGQAATLLRHSSSSSSSASGGVSTLGKLGITGSALSLTASTTAAATAASATVTPAVGPLTAARHSWSGRAPSWQPASLSRASSSGPIAAAAAAAPELQSTAAAAMAAAAGSSALQAAVDEKVHGRSNSSTVLRPAAGVVGQHLSQASADATGATAEAAKFAGRLSAYGVVLSPATRLSLGAAGGDGYRSSGRPSLSSESEAGLEGAAGGSGISNGRWSIGGASNSSISNVPTAIARLQPQLHVPAGQVVPGRRRSSDADGSGGVSPPHMNDRHQQQQQQQQDQQQHGVAAGPLAAHAPKLPLLSLGQLLSRQKAVAARDVQWAAPAQAQQDEPLLTRQRQQDSSLPPPVPLQQLRNSAATVQRASASSAAFSVSSSGVRAAAAPSKQQLVSRVLTTGLTDFDGDSDSGDEQQQQMLHRMPRNEAGQAAAAASGVFEPGPGLYGVVQAAIHDGSSSAARAGTTVQGRAVQQGNESDEFDF